MEKKNRDDRKILIYLTIFIVLILITTYFTIAFLPGIKLIIKSPGNTTYNKNSIVLEVSCDDPLLWIAESFDGGPNITECGNCNSYTRYDLIFTKGTHTITAYGSDFNNRILKASVTFVVK